MVFTLLLSLNNIININEYKKTCVPTSKTKANHIKDIAVLFAFYISYLHKGRGMPVLIMTHKGFWPDSSREG